ncbi:glycosyltransferase family protein [Paenibacillus tarimensis]
MNERKICFITCVADPIQYRKSLSYIYSLSVPEGYEIERIADEQAEGLTAAYNRAMKSSDAKYKVYLHQDVWIMNANFLNDVIKLFQKYPKLGMIGTVGAKTIPANGIWWESLSRYGKIYDSVTGGLQLLAFHDIDHDYESVRAIDGLIMMTQFDVCWREDLFSGWHFYDLSQSLEFNKAGYDVGVPKQERPWCIHDCGIVNVRNGYEEAREIFIRNYSEWLDADIGTN